MIRRTKILVFLLAVFPYVLLASDLDTGLEDGKEFSDLLMNGQENKLIPDSSNQVDVPQYSSEAEKNWSKKGKGWEENPEDIETDSQIQLEASSEGQFLTESIYTRPVFNIDYSDPAIQNYKSIQDAIDQNYSACVTKEVCLEESTQEWEETETCFYELSYSEPTCTIESNVSITTERYRWLEINIDGNDDHYAYTLYVDSDGDGEIDKTIDMPETDTCFYKHKGSVFGDNENRCWRLARAGWTPISCPSDMDDFGGEWNDPFGEVENYIKNLAESIWGLPVNSSSPAGGVDNIYDSARRCESGQNDGGGSHWKWEVVITEEIEEITDQCQSAVPSPSPFPSPASSPTPSPLPSSNPSPSPSTTSPPIGSCAGGARQRATGAGNLANPGDTIFVNAGESIQNAVNRANPGDRIVLRAGTHKGCLKIGLDEGQDAKSGTSGSPITLTAEAGAVWTTEERCTIGTDRRTDRPINTLIWMTNRSYWIIEGLTISYTAGGISTFKTSFSTNLTIRDNKIEGNDRGAQHLIDLDGENRNVLIDRNIIRNFPSKGDIYGVFLGNRSNLNEFSKIGGNRITTIQRNTFHGLGGDGIQIGNSEDEDVLIENNDFMRVYTDPPEENAIDIKRSRFITVRNNIMRGYRPKAGNRDLTDTSIGTGSSDGSCVVIHNGADDILIEGNTIYDCNMGINISKGALTGGDREIERIKIVRNLIFDTDKYPFPENPGQFAFGAGAGVVVRNGTEILIAHNVFAFSQANGVLISSDVDGAAVTNNVFYINGLKGIDARGRNIEIGKNLFHLSPNPVGNTINGDPLFISPSTNAGQANYRLRAGSPAIDEGERIVCINDVFSGLAPDLGRYEFGNDSFVGNQRKEFDLAAPEPPGGSVNGSFSVGEVVLASSSVNASCRLESSTCLESGDREIIKPLGGEFVISGSSDIDDNIFVNEDLDIYVNGSLAFTDETTEDHNIRPVHLVLVDGDTLQVVAKDTGGGRKELSPIWLHNITTGEKIQIFSGVSESGGCNCVFADFSYTLDWETTVTINRPCWREERKYICPDQYVEDEKCGELKAAGCYQVDSECIEINPDRQCVIFEQTYRCPKTGDTLCTKSRTEVVCNGEIRCQFGVDCFDPTYEPNTDFHLAAANLGWLADIQRCLNQDYQDPAFPPDNTASTPIDCADIDPLNIFKAKRLQCDRNLAGFIQDCCVDSGLLSSACPEKARELVQRRKSGACHYVGSYCSKDVVGFCVQRRSRDCCANSKLARIIHEQGRPQLIEKGLWPTTVNEGWGKPEKPNCDGFSPEQLQAIDFSKIDFSEFYNDIEIDIMPPDIAATGTGEDEGIMETEDCPYNPEIYPELCTN